MSNLLKNNSSAWQLLTNDFKSNHLAHAYLLCGPEGLGKKSLAKEYIKYMVEANEVLSKRIDENNFLDLLCLEKLDKNEIIIDQIRKAHDFFNQTSAESEYKFVIIDAVDDLNLNAANALLKILEEPRPNTHIFLINHVSGKALATIRSRCRIINFKPVELADNFLEDLIAGSSGKAESLNKMEAIKLYEQLLGIIKDKDILGFNKFVDSFNKKPELWHLSLDLLMFFFSRCIKFAVNTLLDDKLLPLEKNLFTLITNRMSVEQLFKAYDEAQDLIKQNEIFNLDKKQVLLIIINSLES